MQLVVQVVHKHQLLFILGHVIDSKLVPLAVAVGLLSAKMNPLGAVDLLLNTIGSSLRCRMLSYCGEAWIVNNILAKFSWLGTR